MSEVVWDQPFEDEFGLESNKGEGSSRALTECGADSGDSSGADAGGDPDDSGPPPPPPANYIGVDTFGEFKYLTKNVTYTGVVESHYMRTTVKITLIGDEEAGIPFDFQFSYVMTGLQEDFSFSETFPGIFVNDPIAYNNSTATGYESLVGNCDGYGTFTTGNVSTNPYIDENGAFIVTTVSGKKWAWYVFMLGQVNEVPNMVNNVKLINDGRLIHYKKRRKTPWLG